MQPLLLLHGAVGATDQLEPLADHLKEKYLVHLLNFAGHGGAPLPTDDFSIQLFADETLNYLKQKNIPRISVFGYSMGGYVAMYLARHHPEIVEKIITLGTKFNWDESIAAQETKMLNYSRKSASICQAIGKTAFSERLENIAGENQTNAFGNGQK
jgi:pimeloyl-ACP methyl ester carboxylesterase